MISLRFPLAGLTVLLFGLLVMSCQYPSEPVFDNSRDPYGTTFAPRPPVVVVERFDSTTVHGAIWAEDLYVASVTVERRDGNDPTYKSVIAQPGRSWSFTDAVKGGMTYYYRCVAIGVNGRASAYSMTVAVYM